MLVVVENARVCMIVFHFMKDYLCYLLQCRCGTLNENLFQIKNVWFYWWFNWWDGSQELKGTPKGQIISQFFRFQPSYGTVIFIGGNFDSVFFAKNMFILLTQVENYLEMAMTFLGTYKLLIAFSLNPKNCTYHFLSLYPSIVFTLIGWSHIFFKIKRDLILKLERRWNTESTEFFMECL